MKNILRMMICGVLFLLMISGMSVHAEGKDINSLKDISVTFQGGTKYSYSGEMIYPTVSKVTFTDENGEYQEVTEGISITFSDESNLMEVGSVDVYLSLEGYEGDVLIKKAFSIVFDGVTTGKTTPVNYNHIKLQWNQVNGADGYVIYRSTVKGTAGKALKTITSGKTLTYSDKSVKIGTKYYYSIKAFRNVNGKCVYAGVSAQVAQTAQLAKAKITSVKKSAYNYLTVKWNKVSSASGYILYRSDSENGTYKKVATIKSAKTLQYKTKVSACGKTYYYKVKAYRTYNKKNYNGVASAAVSGYTTPNTIQFNSNTMSGRDSVKLYWDASKGAAGYVVYRSTKKDADYEKVKVISNAKTLKWTDKNLEENQVYYYKVRPYVTVNKKNVYGSCSKVYQKILVSEQLENIRSYTYVKYVSGGKTPSGWDCSGFTQWALKYIYGASIPKYSGDQAKTGKAIDKKDMSKWQPGDILVYSTGGRVSHVALYLGDGKLMHALNKKYGTIIQDVKYYESWDKKNSLSGVRRCF